MPRKTKRIWTAVKPFEYEGEEYDAGQRFRLPAGWNLDSIKMAEEKTDRPIFASGPSGPWLRLPVE